MVLKQQLTACLKQTAQMEQEAQSLGLAPSEQVRLVALLRSAKDALAEAEKMIPQEDGDGQQEAAAKLQLWERKLLDLSLRNNLLNMKLGKNAIRYEHDDIATLEDELDQGKEFILDQKELKGIYRAVRTNLEESGVNTLFLTFGSLNWNERAGGRQYAAPILLVPVEIVPIKKQGYAIRKRDEEVMLNITLMEMLKQQYEIEVEGVNPLPRDAHGIDVSLVLHLVREAVKVQKEWEVIEDSVLGIFSFSKFVMWNDIHIHGAAVMESPVISSLVEGRLMMEDEGEPVDARQLDITMRPEKMALPVDIDSSQLEAVAEAERGRSFILFGPPGTGKSQTITNLIANALYHQQRVLFVAEKKAALEVVQSRLEKIGLAPFCLELHSNKVDKQHFLRQMQQAIDAVGAEAPEGFQRVADQLFQQRLQLISYIDALHQKQADGTSLYDAINRYLTQSADRGGHPLSGMIPKQRPQSKVSSYMMGDTLDKQLPLLPQIIEGVKKQLERGQKMSYFNKTPRQLLEADYKWRKFAALADVDNDLLDDLDKLSAAAERWKQNMDLLPLWEQCAAAMRQTDCASLEQVIDHYRELTNEFRQLTREELVARLSAQVPVGDRDPEISSELTLLRKRIGNKGRGATIRNIIDQMPALLPKLCPVMLMSPLSVAQYLDINAPKFDLVIFDEASQMPTSEAVGSICRGKAVIVVGDPKQMPPTSFFSANTTDDDEADVDDLESILDDCISLSMPSRYLAWHYRSKHESLIAFSNQNYYDGKLTTFPSADDMIPHVTWQHVDGYYDYGKTRTNRFEAEAIVAETIHRLQNNPERSIGIVAFSKPQSDLIEDLLNEALVQYPELEQLNQEAEEPLFIKNLENVQGDERDVILFSVGYGPDKDGHLSMNFGPLNKIGGERRLNVAVSRARYEMKVFSTLLPEQIDERRTQAEGVLGLKQFMRYAQQGALKSISSNASEDSSLIGQQIAEALLRKGYDVKTNVGSSALRIDIAIIDPLHKDHYALGIVLDGVNYYHLKTARDREIVQPTVLQMLGWRLMHVWTVDWLSHPENVIKVIMNNIEL
jgi:KaiC/GvpD/RAD55 family RecA-like ATPase